MKTTIKTLLLIAIAALAYFCVMSILTPIRFEKERTLRERTIIQNLVDLRNAQIEFKDQKGYYTSGLDSLISFIKTGKKKMVLKEGVLTDAQLEAGLTEAKAVKIIKSGNKKEIAEYGLEKFKRDTTTTDLISALYGSRYNKNTIDTLQYIPFGNGLKFEMEVKNDYTSNIGIRIPLCEIRVPYDVYLKDVNRQETLNLIDLEEKLGKYAGLKVGSATEPNNFAGNWE